MSLQVSDVRLGTQVQCGGRPATALRALAVLGPDPRMGTAQWGTVMQRRQEPPLKGAARTRQSCRHGAHRPLPKPLPSLFHDGPASSEARICPPGTRCLEGGPGQHVSPGAMPGIETPQLVLLPLVL